MTREIRFIKKSELDKYSMSDWYQFFKAAERYNYIVTDDNGNIISGEEV